MRVRNLTGALALSSLLCVSFGRSSLAQLTPGSRPVVVASKPFAESYILAEMFAQLLEARGVAVDRRPGLGATEIAFQALRTGAIDVYPEYTGTGLLAILGEKQVTDPDSVFARVFTVFRDRYSVRWLPPLGFENTYAIAVRQQTARDLGLTSLSDLARTHGQLRAGLTPDFIGREDGLPGLRKHYGFNPREVRSLLPAVKYRALAEGEVDIIDGYSTDGLIARYNLVVLEDDRRFFPPYQAAALVGRDIQRSNPRVVAILSELSGRMDVRFMRRLNRRLEVDGESVQRVAESALSELGFDLRASAMKTGDRAGDQASRASLLDYMYERRSLILSLTLRHLLLVALSLGAAILVGVPLGLGLERASRGAESVVRAVGILQTVPSIALLAFMIPVFGIGVRPALIALFLYSLYPIVRNTLTGVRDADRGAVDAATALGMTPRQVLAQVRLPLATPVIMAGIRTAAVIGVGTATLAAFIGAGGLGDPIVAGLALSDTRMILSGAIPAALLALAIDALLGGTERLVAPGR
ncbi:MAG: glycine betaine ABC transporter substrate-binding protein [Gemmatimonadaceae bacterium]